MVGDWQFTILLQFKESDHSEFKAALSSEHPSSSPNSTKRNTRAIFRDDVVIKIHIPSIHISGGRKTLTLFEGGEFKGSHCDCPAGNRSVKCCWHRLCALLLVLHSQGPRQFSEMFPSPKKQPQHVASASVIIGNERLKHPVESSVPPLPQSQSFTLPPTKRFVYARMLKF